MPTRPVQDAVKPDIGVAATYTAFLDAIAARSFDSIHEHASERLRAHLREMRGYTDFPVLFELWCGSYPRVARFLSVCCDEETALVDIQGDVDGEKVCARVWLRRAAGKWHVDGERFGLSRNKHHSGDRANANQRIQAIEIGVGKKCEKAPGHKNII